MIYHVIGVNMILFKAHIRKQDLNAHSKLSLFLISNAYSILDFSFLCIPNTTSISLSKKNISLESTLEVVVNIIFGPKIPEAQTDPKRLT